MKKLIIILFLLIAGLVQAGSIGMSKGKFEVPKNLKGGGVYDLGSTIVYNSLNTPATFEISLEQFGGQKELFEPSHFQIEPMVFQLDPNGSQEVRIKIVIPRNKFINGNYKAILQAKVSSIILPEGQTESSDILSYINPAVGAIITYKVAGKMGLGEKVFISLENIFNNGKDFLTASLASIGIDFKTTAITSSVIIGIYIFSVIIKQIFRVFRRIVKKRKPEPVGTPRISGNVLDLRGVKSK